jgi:hypothetical protein
MRFYWICGEAANWNFDGRPFIAGEFAGIVPPDDMVDVLNIAGTIVSEAEARLNYPILLEAWQHRDDSVAESNLALWAMDVDEAVGARRPVS